jgi:hypothetical protein
MSQHNWKNTQSFDSQSYECGYCSNSPASNNGYQGALKQRPRNKPEYICICHFCGKPTYITHQGDQYPGVAYGESVEEIDDEQLGNLYEEARQCMAVNAYTASVMACRKALMNIAVDQDANEDLSFKEYVGYLADNDYVPPNGEDLVDHIRNKGNEANHEISAMTYDEAKELVDFTKHLLTFIYTLPAQIEPEE